MPRVPAFIVASTLLAASAPAAGISVSEYEATSRDEGPVAVDMGSHEFCALSFVVAGGFNSGCAVTQDGNRWTLTAFDPPAPDPWTGESQACMARCFGGGTQGGGGVVGGLGTRLTSGTYKVGTTAGGRTYPGTFRLTVAGGALSGTSEWQCCPGPRTDPLKGRIEGDRVVIERDCTGQGIAGPCRQIYTGTLRGNQITGTFTSNGSDAGTWSLQLP